MKKTILIIVLAALCPNFRLLAQINTHPGLAPIEGKVTDEKGQSLPGATVKVKNASVIAITDKDGTFKIGNVAAASSLLVSFVGYQTVDVPVPKNPSEKLIIQLIPDAGSLNEVQVIGYGTTTKRLNTGSVSTITAKEIEEQPVTNVLSALSGRAPGVFVQTTNGLPGGNINIQIRGKGSLTAGTNPLYIVDGIPFASSVVPSNSVLANASINGAESPFNSINPEDIQSISILKDADATAIYGSRGANGVVLITTKKGKAGKTKVDFTISEGENKVANLPSLLNLAQYLQIRREAYKNDQKMFSSNPSSSSYAPDLTVWDTTKSTNWPKYLLGGTGRLTDAQGSVSGGSANTLFNIGGSFHSETTILPGHNIYERGGIHSNLQHTSLNKRFSIDLTTSYTVDNNSLVNPSANIASDILLAPNYPLYDAIGNLNWYSGSNPVAEINAISKTQTDNLVTNLSLRYALLKNLNLKVSTGYNKININETQTYPTVSLYPGSKDYSNFGKNSNKAFIVEPQVEYLKDFKTSNINLLAGATYQHTIAEGEYIKATGFSSEALLNNLASASAYSLSNSYTEYKYESVFARVTYTLLDKYILNGSIRRDGSSRFGPNNRFGNFGAIGAAWIFSTESFIKENFPFISFGKLRASYGITGNDQIPDYQYLSTYTSSANIYQGISALQPTVIANSNFHWEVTKKLDCALELGFIQNRLLITVDKYTNKSSDQLVAYAIPYLTGFSTYQANLPAVILNSGWEAQLNTTNIKTSNFSWITSLNVTIPKNKLLSFENFASSSYAQTLAIDYDVTRVYGYKFLGVNAATGQANYASQPESKSTSPYNYYTEGKLTPDFYGGVGNSFMYKSWSLEVFGQFSKQMLLGGITYTPGRLANNYILVLDRWEGPGDNTGIPRASTVNDSYYKSSNANFFNASYFRLKNVSISYVIPSKLLNRFKIEHLKIYLQGENLFTFWNKNAPILDPESGALTTASKNIPPIRTLVAGLQITL